mmetsp:Transcript_31156/g.5609  ORF Transcript_31156/g.5609 Transcript_31156/m.5609 type:complete len:113 (-) Transcript_31156:438-776(-)
MHFILMKFSYISISICPFKHSSPFFLPIFPLSFILIPVIELIRPSPVSVANQLPSITFPSIFNIESILNAFAVSSKPFPSFAVWPVINTLSIHIILISLTLVSFFITEKHCA